MDRPKKLIDFERISAEQFEELCFELILKYGFSNVIWRKGGADSGRDIEGYLSNNNSLLGKYVEHYFFECKNYKKGVPPEVLHSKLAWADSESPDHLVFFISSYLTNSARQWLRGIEKQKSYKIHIVEGERLSNIIAQHQDLVVKYFINDEYINLLNDTIEKWVIHNLIPSFHTYSYLLENLELASLSINHKTFMLLVYYAHYSKLEEMENEYYHGIDISDFLNELISDVKEYANTDIPLLRNYESNEIDALSDQGCLNWDEDEKNYDFIASEVAVKSASGGYKLTNYLFKRINNDEALEILIFQNLDLEYQIRYIEDYKFDHYKEVVELISWKPEYANRVLSASERMR